MSSPGKISLLRDTDGDNLEDTLDIWRQLVEIYEREILNKK